MAYSPDATKLQAGLYYLSFGGEDFGLVKVPLALNMEENVTFDDPVEGKTPLIAVHAGFTTLEVVAEFSEWQAALLTNVDGDLLTTESSKVYFGGHPFTKSTGVLQLRPVTAGDMQVKEIYFYKAVPVIGMANTFGDNAQDDKTGLQVTFRVLRDPSQTNGKQIGYISFTDSDTTAPTLSSSTPTDEAIDIAIADSIELIFSEAMAHSAGGVHSVLKSGNIVLVEDPAGTKATIATTITYNSATYTVTVNPDASLTNSTVYLVIVTTDVADESGNTIAAEAYVSFTTVAP